ncbi:MAG: hypothetical protein KGL39_37065 [Patescibacteria group bacterium]|nr:hypothetical protein [Patescibacteria group bacterium]
MDLIIYHADCHDGFCCAWLCHRVWPDAEYLPVHHDDTPPDVAGRRVLIADFSFSRFQLNHMLATAQSLLVLDHHKSAWVDLSEPCPSCEYGTVRWPLEDGGSPLMECGRCGGKSRIPLPFVRFDQEKSGGRLTWEYLVERFATGQDAIPFFSQLTPWLVDFTEDRDLWKWKLPNSRAINAALRSYPMDFAEWGDMAKFLDPTAYWSSGSLINEGEAILRYQDKLIEQHVQRAGVVMIGGHKVLCVNCTCLDLASEIAGALAEDRPFGACWHEEPDGRRVYQLRSRDGGGGGIDVLEVAKRYGGGGHARASGFTLGTGVGP